MSVIGNGNPSFVYRVDILPMGGAPFAPEFETIPLKRADELPRGDVAKLAVVNRHISHGDDHF